MRRDRDRLEITLQDLRTRRMLSLGSWEQLLAVLQGGEPERDPALAQPPPLPTLKNR